MCFPQMEFCVAFRNFVLLDKTQYFHTEIEKSFKKTNLMNLSFFTRNVSRSVRSSSSFAKAFMFER